MGSGVHRKSHWPRIPRDKKQTYASHHQHHLQRITGRRRCNLIWVYDGDGQFPYPRIKGEDKRYWKRWRRRQEKKEQQRGVA